MAALGEFYNQIRKAADHGRLHTAEVRLRTPYFHWLEDGNKPTGTSVTDMLNNAAWIGSLRALAVSARVQVCVIDEGNDVHELPAFTEPDPNSLDYGFPFYLSARNSGIVKTAEQASRTSLDTLTDNGIRSLGTLASAGAGARLMVAALGTGNSVESFTQELTTDYSLLGPLPSN